MDATSCRGSLRRNPRPWSQVVATQAHNDIVLPTAIGRDFVAEAGACPDQVAPRPLPDVCRVGPSTCHSRAIAEPDGGAVAMASDGRTFNVAFGCRRFAMAISPALAAGQHGY